MIAAELIAAGRAAALELGDRLAALNPATYYNGLREHVAWRHADTARERHELAGLMRLDLATAMHWRRIEVRVVLAEIEAYHIGTGLGGDLADVRRERRERRENPEAAARELLGRMLEQGPVHTVTVNRAAARAGIPAWALHAARTRLDIRAIGGRLHPAGPVRRGASL